jgi:hypothetical protein
MTTRRRVQTNGCTTIGSERGPVVPASPASPTGVVEVSVNSDNGLHRAEVNPESLGADDHRVG